MDNKTTELYIDNKLISPNIVIADTFLKRFKGLMLKKTIPSKTGYFFPGCHSIHTSFMRFSIDLFYLKRQNGHYNIVDIRTAIKPWHISSCRKADSVIEFKSGDIKNVPLLKDKTLSFSDSF